MNESQFQNQLWRLIDGDLSPEEFAELEKYLSSNPEARAMFIEQIELHNILELGLSVTATSSAHPEGVISMDRILARQHRRALKYSAIGAAALLAIALTIFTLILSPNQAPIVAFRTTEGSTWNVTHPEGHQPKNALSLIEGSRLELRQGSLEFTTDNGVTARVNAPADFTVLAENRIRQDLGIIHYRVPAEAIGFRVETPQLRIKDLGTEFGVIRRAGKPDEAHLLKGSIEVATNYGQQEGLVINKPQALVAGDDGTLKPTELRPDEFMTELAETIPYIHFPFDSVDGKKIHVSGNYEDLADISARLVNTEGQNETGRLTDGKHGKALRLTGSGDYVQTNWPGIGGRTPRTIAFWLRLPEGAEAEKFQGIVLWGDTRDSGGKFVVNWNFFTKTGNLGALRFNCAAGNVVGETDLRDGNWHHVAVVLGGSTDPENGMGVTLYVDGIQEKVSGTRYGDPDTVLGNDEDSWLSIGRFFDVDVPNHGTLRGDIDDLYIFQSALTPESIQDLMENGW